MSNSNVSTPKKPGRRAETPLQKLQRIESEMERARDAAKTYEQHTLAMLALAVIAEAQENAELMATLRDVSTKRVTSKSDMGRVMELLDRTKPIKAKRAA